jgi:hypothetical protein
VKNWQYFLFLANRDLAVCKLHRTFSLAKMRVRFLGSLISWLPLPIRTYLPVLVKNKLWSATFITQ